jgi:glycosyltransferase involved in cell wall biosynthesis
MYKEQHVTVVVPAYNEERHIGDTLRTIPTFVDRIIVIDDCSTDGTAAVVESIDDPRIVFVRNPVNRGYGATIIVGHRKALELGGDINAVMDGDGQMNPDYLDRLLDPLIDEGYQFAKGNRFDSRASLKGMPPVRVFGNVVLSVWTNIASGYWRMFDSQNGYTAIRQEALAKLPLGTIATGYPYSSDLLIKLNTAGFRMRDVPVPARYGDELSGIRLRVVIPQMSATLVTGYWRRLWAKYVVRVALPLQAR